MPAEGRENPLLKKGNSDAFFREKYLTKNKITGTDTKRFITGIVPVSSCREQRISAGDRKSIDGKIRQYGKTSVIYNIQNSTNRGRTGKGKTRVLG